MLRKVIWLVIILGLVFGVLYKAPETSWAQISELLDVREVDGSPAVSGVSRVLVGNGSLIDDGVQSGRRQVTISSASGDALHFTSSGATHDPNTNACSSIACDCITVGKDRYLNTNTRIEWVCTDATANTWVKIAGTAITGQGDPNDGGVVSGCTLGTSNRCDCRAVYADRYLDSISNREWLCGNSANDVWIEIGPFTRSGFNDPNIGDVCLSAYKDRYFEVDSLVEWVCITAGNPGVWAEVFHVQEPTNSMLTLAENEIPAAYFIPAFGSGDANDMKVSNCTFNVDLNVISCDQTTEGQSLELLEAVGGNDAVTLQVANSLSGSKLYRTTPSGQFPADMVEHGYEFCVDLVSLYGTHRLLGKITSASTLVDAQFRCIAALAAQSDDVANCSATSVDIYSCPNGSNNDIPTNCTKRGDITGTLDEFTEGTFGVANGGNYTSGEWVMAVMTGFSPSSSDAMICVQLRTD